MTLKPQYPLLLVLLLFWARSAVSADASARILGNVLHDFGSGDSRRKHRNLTPQKIKREINRKLVSIVNETPGELPSNHVLHGNLRSFVKWWKPP